MKARFSNFRVLSSMLLWALSLAASSASAQVTLLTTAAPSAGSPGTTVVNVTGSGFPTGTIPAANVTVTLTPSGSGTAIQTTPSAVTTILESTRRVTFLIPKSISVSMATVYLVSISGSTSTAVAFSSSNSSKLTINPGLIGGISLSTQALTYASQTVGTVSTSQTITATSNGTGPLTISSIAPAGMNPADFGVTNVNCPIAPATLASGSMCNVQVTFNPLAIGARNASVVFTDDTGGVPGSQQSVTLSGTGTAAAPSTTVLKVSFTPGTNVSGVTTVNCPSGTSPCTDSQAHSLKVVVGQVNSPFTLTVTAYEVPLSEGNGVCEAGQTETTDFDCRFKNYFTYATQPNGDVIVPQCYPYSNGNCIYYRVSDVPQDGSFAGPIFQYIAWNDNAYVPPSIYAANNPRVFYDPSAPPYDLDHQFVFDITDFFVPGTGQVGKDPGLYSHTKQFSDFTVAFPSSLPIPPYTFAFVAPTAGASFVQGSTVPTAFTLTQGSTFITNAVTPPNAVSLGLLNSHGVRLAALAPGGTPAAFTYNGTAQQYVLSLSTSNLPTDSYTLYVTSNLFLQQSISFAVTPAPLQITTTSLPAGDSGAAYSIPVIATGGTASYAFALTAGNLPNGILLDSKTGILSGTPTASGSFTFTVTVTDSGVPVQSKNTSFTLVVGTIAVTPSVTLQPVSQTINAGNNVTFSSAASGTPVPAVQWQVSVDGGVTFTNIVGANSTSLTFTTLVGLNGNQYRAVFTNIMGSATSSAATLTVDTAPEVTTNPTSQTVANGATATFTGAATGNPAPTVQWQVSTNGGVTFTNVIGATSNTLSFAAASTQSGNLYRAIFTNSLGTATTTVATLTVGSGPVVTTQPVGIAVNSGATAAFTAAATGSPTPTVQWQVSVDGGVTFTNVTGATSTTLSFTAAATQDGNLFRAVFTNTGGSATTSAATLTVNTAPTITTTPTSQTATNGATVTFVAAASGKPVPTVQWQVSTNSGVTFTNVTGATSTALSFTAASTQNGNQYRAVFTNSVGSATTTAVTLTVTTGPVVTTQPVSIAVNSGATATFTAAATGSPTPTVQWQVSTNAGVTFTNITGATTTSLSFTTASTQNGNQYRAVFTNTAGSATTSAATLTVNAAPTITTNPTSQTVGNGAAVTFTAAATGTPTPTVQWQSSVDGGVTFTNITSATSTTLSFTAASTQNGNQYRAVFTNSVGSATTTAATLTVNSGPVVTTQPVSITVNSGATATFTAAASGIPTPTVQWQVSADGGVTFTNVSGATSTTFSFTAAATQDGNQFRAVFTNTSGSANSNAATLTVNTAPTITTNPTSQTASSGAAATFTAAASGKPVPTVQWQVSTDGGVTFTNVSGATSTTFSFTAASTQNGNLYRAVFTNSVGSATTTAATLTVNSGPVVTTQPVSIAVNSGATATFTAAATGSPTPTVQWQVSTNAGVTFTNITGATTTSLSFTTASTQNGNQYRAVFTNTAGSATTSAATLTVNTAPVVTTNPTSQTAANGATATFTAAASGNPAPTVQWQVSTNSGVTFTNVIGATSNTLSFAAASTQNGNLYRAVFTNSVGSATTTAATLTVTTGPVVITQPVSIAVNSGATATFTAAATGTPTPTVQWQVSANGGVTFTNITGATSTTLGFTAAASQNGNLYQAVFTNTAGSATTSVATLTVNTAPTITTNPTSQTVGNGAIATFAAAATGTPTPTVQWQVSTDGGVTFTNVSGATSTTFSFTAASTQNGNLYRAVFTNSVGSATTTAATLTVNSGPVVTTQPVSIAVNSGATATFTAAATGSPTPTVQWQVSTNAGVTFTNITGATTTSLSFTTASTQNGNQYRAVFTNTAGSATTSAATLTVNAAPTITTNPTSQTVGNGAAVTFTAAATGTPTPTVQWQSSVDGGVTFTNITSATSTTLSFTAASTQNGNQYRAVFTNSVGSATTTAATLTVNSGPVVTTQPVSITVNSGATATFTAAASGIPTPTVQWQVSADGGVTFTNVSGATSTTFSFTAAATQDGNQFRAVFTNTSGSANSNAATLTVNTAPTITTNPTSQTASSGAAATFTAAASGKPVPTVQWQVSTDGGVTFSNITGATSTTLSFITTLAQTNNRYRAVFTNSVGSATTTAATLTVTSGITITSTTLPGGAVGSTYSTTLTATGGTGPYTWSITVGTLPGGLSLAGSTGVISGVPTTVQTASFTIKVTDSTSATQTAVVTININPAALQITTSSLPDGQLGVAYTSAVSVTGGTAPYTFAITSGALPSNVNLNTSTGAITGTPTSSGTFTVTFTVNDSSVPVQNKSASFTFTIVGAPAVTLASPNIIRQGDVGDTVFITGQFTHFVPGTTTVNFGSTDVTVNSVSVTNATSLSVNVSVSLTAVIGTRTITVTTGSEVATGTGLITVQAGIPVVSLAPSFGVEGANPTITINGTFTHFTQAMTSASFGGDIVAGAVTVNSPVLATVQLQISATASLGARAITINTGTESAQGNFTVTQGVPIITSVTPNVGGQSATVTVNVNSLFTSWVNGTTVVRFGPGIAVGGGTSGGFGPVTVNSATSFTATLTISATATLGPHDITVQTGTELELSAGAYTVANCTTTAAVPLYYNPESAAQGVPLNVHPRVEYNAPLDRTTINNTNAYISDNATGMNIPGTASVDPTGRIVTVIPSQLLAVGRSHIFYFGYNATAKDACGNQVYTANSFTTAFTPQTAGPSVLQHSPLNGDPNVPENTQIVFQLSEPMDPVSIVGNSAAGSLTTGTTNVPTTVTFSPDYTIITLVPGTTLAPSTTYTMTYTNQSLDQAGNPLSNPGSFSFTTGTATDTVNGSVLLSNPAPNETGVGTNVQPSFTLSKIIDPITVSQTNAYIVDNATGKLIAATVSVAADRMHVTLTPLQPLQGGTTFQIVFGYGAQALDLAGNYISGYYSYFTTAGAPITSALSVTAISPVNGAAGVPVNSIVTAGLSAPLDPTTVSNSSISVTPSVGPAVTGTVTLGADLQTLVWVGGANLAVSTSYTVNVGGVKDAQGNMVTPFASGFTTGISGTPVTVGPMLVSTVPTNGATGVSNTAKIAITFSEPINPETVTNILIRDESNGYANIAGTWAVTTNGLNQGVATFTPANRYPGGATLDAYTQDQVRDYAGNTDSGSVVTIFTIAAGADTTHPTVTSVTPANGATGIGRNAQVVLAFSKSINPSTVNSTTLQVFVGETAVSLGQTVSADNRTVALTGNFPANTVITVVATPTITDLSGNTLVPFQSNFTTAPDFSVTSPVVVTQRPANTATDVPVNAVVTLFTNGKPLNVATVSGSTVLVSQNGVLINGTISVLGDGHAIKFVPSENFNYGALVQVFLSPSIQDTDGNFLTAYNGQFTVAGNPATVGAMLIATNPFNGAASVPLNAVVQAQFDQPLLGTTVNATNVRLYDTTLGYLTGTVTLTGPNSNIIQFQPTSPLGTSHGLQFYLTGVLNSLGTPISSAGDVLNFSSGTAADTTTPTVKSVSPIDTTANIGTNALIVVQFSKTINPISVNGATVQVTSTGYTAIPVSMSFDASYTSAMIAPQAPLPANTLMTLTINGVTDLEGHTVTPKTTHFTTGPGPDTTSANVIHFSPDAGATGVPTNTAITIQWDKPMNVATLQYFETNQVYLYDTITGLPVPTTSSLSSDFTTITLVPVSTLAVNRGYLIVAYGALDLDGNPAVNNYTSFTTAFQTSATIPSVVITSPENTLTNVPVNSPIQVLFNEPIKPESIANVTLRQGVSTVPTTAALSQGDFVLTLTPQALLTPNTVYTISATGVQDVAGHLQVTALTNTFTTGTSIDLVSSSYISFDPTGAATGIGTNTPIHVTYPKRANPISAQFSTYFLETYYQGIRVPLTLSLSADRMTFTFVPTSPLLPNTTYYFSTGSGTTDVAGNALNGFASSFTTGAGPDSSGPTVSSISPANGAVGTPVNTLVQVTMSSLIDPTTISNSSITVKNGATVIAGAISLGADSMTLTWTPSANLSISTTFSVQVGGFTDQSGVAAVPFSSTFTTSASGTPVGAGSLTLVSAVPANSTVGVSNTVKIVLTFSEPINTLSANNIVVRDESNGYYNMAGTWAVTVNGSNQGVATFTPTQPYPASATVDAYTQDRVTDYAGNTDNASVATAFTVASAADTTHPTVTSIVPLNNATNIGPNAPLTLTFSKSINPTTITYQNVRVYAGESLANFSPSLSSDNRTLSLLVNGNLFPSTVYTVALTPGVTDLSGNSLVYFQSQFTTAAVASNTAPTVVTVRPGSGATGVPQLPVITLFTTGASLNSTTVNSNTIFVSQNGLLVSAAVALLGDGHTITVTPAANFAYGSVIQVYLSTAVMDINGVPFSSPYNSSFTIIGDPATTAPVPVAYNPANGSTGVPLNVLPQTSFSQALLSASVNSTNVYLEDVSVSSDHLAGTITLLGPNNSIVQFQPASTLTASHVFYFYTVVSNAQGVTSTYGPSFFTTGTATDTTLPSILGVGPPNSATGVGLNAAIVLSFSKPMDPLTVNSTTVQVTGGSQTVVPMTISFNSTNTMATITPQAPLPANTVMAIAISGITDMVGQAVTTQTTHFTTGSAPDLTAPSVVNTSSVYGDTVGTNATFSAEYDRPMDPGSLNNSAVLLYDNAASSYLTGTVTVSSDMKTATIKPSVALVAGHSVYVEFYYGVDLAGIPQNTYYWLVTVGSGPDTTAPVVLETNPPSASTSVPLNVLPQVEFSKEMDAGSLARAQLLQGGNPVPVTITSSRLNTVVTLTPAVPLLPSTTYTISIVGAKDSEGNALSGTSSYSFTTGTVIKVAQPNVISVTPAANATAVPDNTVITLVFDSPMDPLTFDSSYGEVKLMLQSTGATVPTTVTFSTDYKTAFLSPSASLTSGTIYNIIVNNSYVTDQAGNPVNAGVSQAFTAQ